MVAIGKELCLAGNEFKEWVQKEANAERQERALSRDAEIQMLELKFEVLERKMRLAEKKNSKLTFSQLYVEFTELEYRLAEKRREIGSIELAARYKEVTGLAVCDETTWKIETKKS